MDAHFSLKKPGAWLWSTGHTRSDIVRKVANRRIDGHWLVCPHGEADRAIAVNEFLAKPDIFRPVKSVIGVEPAAPTPVPALAILTALLCLGISVVNAGWLFIIFLWGLPYLVVCVAHVLIHSWAVKRTTSSPAWQYASHLALLLTFLLLIDGGDRNSWIAYKIVFCIASKGDEKACPPSWFPECFLLSLALYVLANVCIFVSGRRSKPFRA